MPRTIVLAPEAELDVTNAYWWYEEQDTGLGEEFLRCLDAAYSRIAEHPEHYPLRFDSIRRILVRRFPYAVYFEHDEATVWIYFVFHCAQHPDRLGKRMKG